MIKKLLEKIENLKKTKIKKLVDNRIRGFKQKKSSNEIFNELCFCILTANYNAEKSIEIQNTVGDGFLLLSENKLRKRLKELGHRFPKARAKYIIEARRYNGSLKYVIENNNKTRDWLVEKIKGIGYKEASHFLRNIGYDDFAIIDFHIIDILTKYKLIEKPKSLGKRKYLEIENLLRKIAQKTELSLAELDLYLWYIETEKILK